MGQTESSTQDKRLSTRGGIFIQLGKSGFVSNEQIYGILNIQLEQSFPGHLLDLTLEGVEETHFTYLTQKQKNQHEDKVQNELKHKKTNFAQGQNSFLNFSLPIYDFCKDEAQSQFKIHPGQWQIPFSLEIANLLPSSMKYNLDGNNNCSLKYRIVANIIPSDQNFRPVSGSQELFICQYMKPILDVYSLDLVVRPKKCCCCYSGYMDLSATLNKRVFAPEESIIISLKCDLSVYFSKVNFITVSLVGKLHLKDGSGKFKIFQTLNQPQVILVTDSKIDNTIEYQIPPTIPLTTIGDFINQTYYICIQADIDSFCCLSANYPLIIPITINPDQKSMLKMKFPQSNYIQTPPNWNPLQIEQAQFTQQQVLSYHQIQNTFRSQQQQQQSICSNDNSFVFPQPQMKPIQQTQEI